MSRRDTAKLYDVPETTMCDRISVATPMAEGRPAIQVLTALHLKKEGLRTRRPRELTWQNSVITSSEVWPAGLQSTLITALTAVDPFALVSACCTVHICTMVKSRAGTEGSLRL